MVNLRSLATSFRYVLPVDFQSVRILQVTYLPNFANKIWAQPNHQIPNKQNSPRPQKKHGVRTVFLRTNNQPWNPQSAHHLGFHIFGTLWKDFTNIEDASTTGSRTTWHTLKHIHSRDGNHPRNPTRNTKWFLCGPKKGGVGEVKHDPFFC